MVPITNISGMIAFFTGGGYKLWAAKADPQGTFAVVADNFYRASNAAISVRHTMKNIAKIKSNLNELLATEPEGKEREIREATLRTEFAHYNELRQQQVM